MSYHTFLIYYYCYYKGNGTEDIVRRYHNSSRLFFFSVHLYDKPESIDEDHINQDYEFFPGSGKSDDIVSRISASYIIN